MLRTRSRNTNIFFFSLKHFLMKCGGIRLLAQKRNKKYIQKKKILFLMILHNINS